MCYHLKRELFASIQTEHAIFYLKRHTPGIFIFTLFSFVGYSTEWIILLQCAVQLVSWYWETTHSDVKNNILLQALLTNKDIACFKRHINLRFLVKVSECSDLDHNLWVQLHKIEFWNLFNDNTNNKIVRQCLRET